MPNIEEMKNKASEDTQDLQDELEQHGESMKDKSGSKTDEVKKKMDRDGDDDFDMEDVKKMGEDAVGKVKGMFKKD